MFSNIYNYGDHNYLNRGRTYISAEEFTTPRIITVRKLKHEE